MKRLLAALSFLVLLFLIWFFWSMENIGKVPTTTIDLETSETAIAVKEAPETLKFKPEKREIKIPLEDPDIDVEVRSDETGLFITKIGDREIDKKISSQPVQRLSVRGGVMSFWEIHAETDSLKYRSLNLNALVARMESQEE